MDHTEDRADATSRVGGLAPSDHGHHVAGAGGVTLHRKGDYDQNKNDNRSQERIDFRSKIEFNWLYFFFGLSSVAKKI